ncbi:MAG: RluA family pseudouridine synthase, partial [Kiritimatiellae bacterium]|nr:RluA family pseudouridine synthase [Kiritimatiellia bacterium]
LLAAGALSLAGASAPLGRADAKRRPAPGETYRLRVPPVEETGLVAQDIPLSVVYEDDAMLVVDKPAGLVVHPAAGHPDGTLVNALLAHCPGVLSVGGERRPGIVHRLDRDTTGLLAVAKTDAALAALQAAFKSGAVKKTYLAIASGVPEPPRGTLDGAVGRNPADRKKMAVVSRGGRAARTDYEVAEDFGRAALLRLRLHTGRTHQIRVHLASIGCPVAGDPVYGSAARDRAALPVARRPARQMLHAWRLELPHPATGEPLSFEAPPPADFLGLLAALRGAPSAIPEKTT